MYSIQLLYILASYIKKKYFRHRSCFVCYHNRYTIYCSYHRYIMSSNDKNKMTNILEFKSVSIFHKDCGCAHLALALQDI